MQERSEIKEVVFKSIQLLGYGPDKLVESTKFYEVCFDWFDFMELLMQCENSGSILINETDKNEQDFDTVKAFIDFIVEKQY